MDNNQYYIYTFPMFSLFTSTNKLKHSSEPDKHVNQTHPPQKCFICKSKRCLVECKCLQTFCLKHRYATEHSCTYNYKESSQSRLSTELVKVVGDKFERIK